MKQVEEALHQLHARDKEKQARDMAEAREEAMNRRLASNSPVLPQAFARVNSISPGSPASIAVILLALPNPLLTVLRVR
jgi:26S proteasome non-ATPase regulatory subunit 9